MCSGTRLSLSTMFIFVVAMETVSFLDTLIQDVCDVYSTNFVFMGTNIVNICVSLNFTKHFLLLYANTEPLRSVKWNEVLQFKVKK